MNKLRAMLIHALGGYTPEEVERQEALQKQRTDRWRNKYEVLQEEMGRIETIRVQRKADPYKLYENRWRLRHEMLEELLDIIRKNEEQLIETASEYDYRAREQTLEMAVRIVKLGLL